MTTWGVSEVYSVTDWTPLLPQSDNKVKALGTLETIEGVTRTTLRFWNTGSRAGNEAKTMRDWLLRASCHTSAPSTRAGKVFDVGVLVKGTASKLGR